MLWLFILVSERSRKDPLRVYNELQTLSGPPPARTLDRMRFTRPTAYGGNGSIPHHANELLRHHYARHVEDFFRILGAHLPEWKYPNKDSLALASSAILKLPLS